jgi:hypothetical protein
MSPVDSLVDRIAAERQAPGRGRQIRPLAVAHKFLPLRHPFTHLSGLSNERARPLEAAAKAITTGSISLIDIQSLAGFLPFCSPVVQLGWGFYASYLDPTLISSKSPISMEVLSSSTHMPGTH